MFSYDRPQCALEDYVQSSQSAVGWTPVDVITLSGARPRRVARSACICPASTVGHDSVSASGVATWCALARSPSEQGSPSRSGQRLSSLCSSMSSRRHSYTCACGCKGSMRARGEGRSLRRQRRGRRAGKSWGNDILAAGSSRQDPRTAGDCRPLAPDGGGAAFFRNRSGGKQADKGAPRNTGWGV